MDKLRIPKKVYFKRGCLPVALREMSEVYGLKGAFLVTTPDLYRAEVLKPVDDMLINGGLGTCEFFTLLDEPTIENVKTGLQKMDEFQPDLIVGVGDDVALNAAKIMWLLYENPEADIAALAAGADFPQMGKKAKLVLIQAGAGTGTVCNPYAGIVDEKTGKKIWLKNYNLTPEMGIVDPSLANYQTAAEIKADGLAALTNAVAAYAAPAKIEYALGFARDAAKKVIANLEAALAGGNVNPVACDNIASASALAGMAYACATDLADPVAAAFEDVVAADKASAAEIAAYCGLADADALVAAYKKLVAL